MANECLVIKVKGSAFKIGDLTTFNKFFYHLESICKKHDACSEQTRITLF